VNGSGAHGRRNQDAAKLPEGLVAFHMDGLTGIRRAEKIPAVIAPR
jgi:hypothetical protein